MLNHVSLMGRLAADPEIRRFNSGVAVCTFRIACDRDIKSQDGTRETDWIDVVAWRTTAEFVEKYFHKGDPIVVTGRIQSRTYQTKDGSKRTAVEVSADSVYFAGSASKDASKPRPAGRPVDVSAAGFDEIEEDSDIPF